MINIIKTDATHKDFRLLVTALDKELAVRDGDDHDFYNQFNGLENIHHCLIAYDLSNEPLGCGAFKKYSDSTVEIKRMFVTPAARGKGVAFKILKTLENWSQSLGYEHCILETGIQQPEAIALYKKAGYQITDNYGQYKGITNSICFSKIIN
ncbi:GNAT family N-acetyltransferase [Aquimarina sp. W85]|uniref:GNAT family N-acetyltransferase n=1 Tax=Aquimarina rhodophyticola TaxID=3342246 RepID=UPI003672A11A